jgi:hypothetical protein
LSSKPPTGISFVVCEWPLHRLHRINSLPVDKHSGCPDVLQCFYEPVDEGLLRLVVRLDEAFHSFGIPAVAGEVGENREDLKPGSADGGEHIGIQIGVEARRLSGHAQHLAADMREFGGMFDKATKLRGSPAGSKAAEMRDWLGFKVPILLR